MNIFSSEWTLRA